MTMSDDLREDCDTCANRPRGPVACMDCEDDDKGKPTKWVVCDLHDKSDAELDRLAAEFMKLEMVQTDGPPTLEELEQMLSAHEAPPVQILPSGEVAVAGVLLVSGRIWSPTTDGRHMLELLAEVEGRGLWWGAGTTGTEYYAWVGDASASESDRLHRWDLTLGRAVVLACLAVRGT